MEKKHTPGPWTVTEYWANEVYGADGFAVAEMQAGCCGHKDFDGKTHIYEKPGVSFIERNESEVEANAKLIAAAPELLEACCAAMAENEIRGQAGPEWQLTNTLMELITKAVQKATT